jgi:hypothetical protein
LECTVALTIEAENEAKYGKKWCRCRERGEGTVFLSSLLPCISSLFLYHFPLDNTYSSTLMMEAAGTSVPAVSDARI